MGTIIKKQAVTNGRTVTIMVNGAILAGIDTSTAVAADFISFMQTVTDALMHKESLEREANASGRTINHPHYCSLGSLPIKAPKGL